jgi:hypothetical protein
MPHKQEVAMLRNHLKITEKTILKHMDEKDENLKLASTKSSDNSGSSLNINNMKIILVKEICHRLRMIDLKMGGEEVELSKKSLPKIKSGYLFKKADKYYTWEERYFLVTNTRLYYWYHKEDVTNNKMPLGYFDLKYLYCVEILRDKLMGDKNNLFHIQTSSWTKKEKVCGPREYYLSCQTRDELYNWVITLNFLRVKAMYDEFSCNFGLINLPLSHEVVKKNKRIVKTKFLNQNKGKNRKIPNFNSIYTTIARKSYASISKSSENSFSTRSILEKNSSLLRKFSGGNKISNDYYTDDIDNVDKINKLKETVVSSFNLGFATIIGFVQDIIFGIENVGVNDDGMITIPNHLNIFKYINTANIKFVNENNLIMSKEKQSVKQEGLYLNHNIEEKEEEDEEENSASHSFDKKKVSESNSLSKSTNLKQEILDKSEKINLKNGVVKFSEQESPTENKSKKQSKISPNKGQMRYDNSIHSKLKMIKFDEGDEDDILEDMINSISKNNIDLSDEEKEIDLPKPKDKKNIFNEINEKQFNNVNSRIFSKK